MSIPTGYLLTGIERAIIPMMDKYEIRRRKVMELIENRCDGVHAKFAEKIERSPSYVGRMLYEEGKKGKKNISDRLIDVIEEKLNLTRGWLDGIGESGSAVASAPSQIEELTEEQQQMLALMSNLDKEARDVLVKMVTLLAKGTQQSDGDTANTEQAKPIESVGLERRSGEEDRRKNDLGFDPERRHYYPAPNFPQKDKINTDRRRKKSE